MKPMRGMIAGTVLLALAACGPRLPLRVIAKHPQAKPEVDRPRVVEKSGDTPAWVRSAGQSDAASVVFIGQASGASLASAEESAKRDLADAVARFISVSVESEMEAEETHKSEGDAVEESDSVHQETRAHVDSALGRVSADATYWEQVASKSAGTSFRFHARAVLARTEIARVRLALAREKARAEARRAVIVVPWTDAAGKDANTLGGEIAAELAAKLSAARDLWVISPQALAKMTATGVDPERAAVQLAADAIVAGAWIERADRIELRYTIRDGKTLAVLAERTASRPSEELFELEEELAREIRQRLAAEARR